MPTPYEEISDIRSSSGNVRTDANLALDSLMLGGIEAVEYATKVYVAQVRDYIINLCKGYSDDKTQAALEAAKAYTDTVVRNIDYSRFATKADLSAAINNAIDECKTYVNNAIASLNINDYETKAAHNQDMTEMNTYINQIYQELFQSVSSGKAKIAAAVTDKGVQTAANATFDTMATNIRAIPSGGGGEGIDTYDATATADKILNGYTAYAKGAKLTGTYKPAEAIIHGETGSTSLGELVYGKAPTESQTILSGYNNIVTGDEGMNIIYQNSCIYINKAPGSHPDIIDGKEVKFAYTFEDLEIPTGFTFKSMSISPFNKNQYKLAIALQNDTDKSVYTRPWYIYVYKLYSSARLINNEYKYIPVNNVSGNSFEGQNQNEYTETTINKWILPMYTVGRFMYNILSVNIIWDTANSNRLVAALGGSSNYNSKGGLIGYTLRNTVDVQEGENPSEKAVTYDTLRACDYEGYGGNPNFDNFDYTFRYAELVNNGKVLLHCYSGNGAYPAIIIFNNSYRKLAESRCDNAIALTTDAQFVVYTTGEVKQLNINYEDGTVNTISTGKTLGITGFTDIRFNSTNEYALVKMGSTTYLYKVDFSQSQILTSVDYSVNTTNSGLTSGRDAMVFTINSSRSIVLFEENYEKVIGIYFDNRMYVAVDTGLYTARPEDVVSGKTFVGYNGTAQVGTMGGGTSE